MHVAAVLAQVHWSVSPDILSLGPITLRWYGLFFALLFLIGYFIARWMFISEHKPTHEMDRMLIFIAAGTIIGARLGHVLFYEPGFYFRNPAKILAVWQGGLASHGGAVGVIVAIYLATRKRPQTPFLWLLDRVAPPTALAAAMIRMGNLFNSEVLGKPADLPWSFVFTRVDNIPRHPVQLYEALSYLVTFLILIMVYYPRRAKTPPGLLLGLFLILVFGARILLEFFKEPQAAYEAADPLLTVGQVLSIPFVILGVYLTVRARKLTNPSPAA